MRAALVSSAVAAVLLAGTTACETAGEVQSGVEEARSSAASLGAGARAACRASEDELRSLGDLSSRLADNPDLRGQLAPEVRQVVDRLSAEVDGRAELQPVVLAARQLASSVGEANREAVRVSAGQAELAVRSAQGACRLAG